MVTINLTTADYAVAANRILSVNTSASLEFTYSIDETPEVVHGSQDAAGTGDYYWLTTPDGILASGTDAAATVTAVTAPVTPTGDTDAEEEVQVAWVVQVMQKAAATTGTPTIKAKVTIRTIGAQRRVQAGTELEADYDPNSKPSYFINVPHAPGGTDKTFLRLGNPVLDTDPTWDWGGVGDAPDRTIGWFENTDGDKLTRVKGHVTNFIEGSESTYYKEDQWSLNHSNEYNFRGGISFNNTCGLQGDLVLGMKGETILGTESTINLAMKVDMGLVATVSAVSGQDIELNGSKEIETKERVYITVDPDEDDKGEKPGVWSSLPSPTKFRHGGLLGDKTSRFWETYLPTVTTAAATLAGAAALIGMHPDAEPARKASAIGHTGSHSFAVIGALGLLAQRRNRNTFQDVESRFYMDKATASWAVGGNGKDENVVGKDLSWFTEVAQDAKTFATPGKDNFNSTKKIKKGITGYGHHPTGIAMSPEGLCLYCGNSRIVLKENGQVLIYGERIHMHARGDYYGKGNHEKDGLTDASAELRLGGHRPFWVQTKKAGMVIDGDGKMSLAAVESVQLSAVASAKSPSEEELKPPMNPPTASALILKKDKTLEGTDLTVTVKNANVTGDLEVKGKSRLA